MTKNKSIEYFSNSSIETYHLGFKFGKTLVKDNIVCFFGDLGAGKTTFIKGVVSALMGTSGIEVNSPTFTYLNIYNGPLTLYHFDLYRFRDADEFLSMGFDEMFDAGGICLIEWAEKIEPLIPLEAIRVEMSHCIGDARKIKISRLIL